MTRAEHWITSRQDQAEALAVILRAERAIGRTLDAGQRRDLLADNFCIWSTEYVRLIIEAIARTDVDRRCDSDLCDAGGNCIACNAIQGEACRKPSRHA
jgi:hypothetical protein